MIKCENTECKHHKHNNTCSLKKAVIGIGAVCNNFEPGLIYYFYLAPDLLKHTNFISLMELTKEIKYSIYILMKCLPIVFKVDAKRGMILLYNKNKLDKPLSRNDILDLIQTDLDSDELEICNKEFLENGIKTSIDTDSLDSNTNKVESQPYGWLSPTGKFTESPWGEHEKSAELIIEQSGFGEEYNEWLEVQSNNTLGINYRDFLVQVKGYALIHDPTNLGYNVQHSKKLTKKQREFLYDYFKDMGMGLIADTYLDD